MVIPNCLLSPDLENYSNGFQQMSEKKKELCYIGTVAHNSLTIRNKTLMNIIS